MPVNPPYDFPMKRRYEELGTNPVSTEPVISAEYFEAERHAVFERSWLMVGRESELPNPGDFFVKRIAPWKSTVVVARGRDGRINAFHDVCPHRGMHVCGREQRGNRKFFTCGSHGWVFGLDGRVVGVSEESWFHTLDKDRLRMPPVAVDSWEGFIFIHRDPAPAESLPEFLGEINIGYGGYFDDIFFKPVGRYEADVKMNYKFYLDSSVEAYHAGYTHLQNNTGQNAKSGTALRLESSATRLYRRHRTIGVPIGVGIRDLAPIEGLAFKHGGAITPYDSRVKDRPLPSGINSNRDENWAFDILEIYPNAILFLSAPLYAVIGLWPSAVDRCRFEVEVYMNEPSNAAERVALEYGLVSLRDVIREDLNIAEGSTDALASGALKEMQLSDQEIAVRHSYSVLNQVMKDRLTR
ncbi:MAG: aromatic ring-hydroxylating dioxygenase subunit alpha [Candidatus Binataceae bacterium]|nr:aromatic ring-hydroxylating dioxygenase subunit alpha [Candidatus Binataceae bacterium]